MKLTGLTEAAAFAILCSSSLFAQRNEDYQRRCQQEVVSRLRVDQRDVFTNMQGTNSGRARVSWTVRSREGYCIIDNRMTVVEFRDNSNGGSGNKGGGKNGGGRPIDVPRMTMDTSGRGTFNSDRSVRITRGWVDTAGQTAVALSGENNFRVMFFGEITQSNGREFTMRITRSDRSNATGTATFRVNGDRNEVESINVNGRINGRDFSGNFNR